MKWFWIAVLQIAFLYVVWSILRAVVYGVPIDQIDAIVAYCYIALSVLISLIQKIWEPSRDERRRQIIERARLGSASDRAAIDRDQSPEAAKRHNRNRFN